MAPGLRTQAGRLMRLHTSLGADCLLVDSWQGREALNEDFDFALDCVSEDAGLDLQRLPGQPATFELLQADASLRSWHGIIERIEYRGSDGGLARYHLRLRSWLVLLAQRSNYLLFQDCDALDIVQRICATYPQSRLRIDVRRTLPQRAICTQYGETDLALLLRLLAEEGLNFRLTQEAGDAWLEIFDRDAPLPEMHPATLRFSRAAATQSYDAVTAWAAHSEIAPDRVTRSVWHRRALRGEAGSADTPDAPAQSLLLEHYEAGRGGPAYEARDEPAASRLAADARLRLDQMRLASRIAHGAGNARQMAAGQAFAFRGHFQANGRYVALSVEHAATNNLGLDPSVHASRQVEPGRYVNRFVAVVDSVALAPPPRPKPAPAGPETALVVGVQGRVLTSDRDHRVKIQFHWQRGEAPNPGGFLIAGGNAPGNAGSGLWVSVAELLAGPNWGSVFTPRIGSEVLVDYLDNDIDSPQIIGRLHNPVSDFPWAPETHPGLSGIRSTEASETGTRRNEWLVDDTPGRISHSLYASQCHAGLQLGHLKDRRPRDTGPARGTGFELATDGWSHLRAAEGLLLSTAMRRQGRSGSMDNRAAVAQLHAAQSLADSLDDAVASAGLNPAAARPLPAMLDALDPARQGHYKADVGGQSPLKHQAGSRKAGQPAERPARPHLQFDAARDFFQCTPGAAVHAAAGGQQLLAQDNMLFAAAQTQQAVSGLGSQLFTHRGGVRAVAGRGPVSLRAHDGELDIQADGVVRVSSQQAGIDIQAKELISLTAGQCQIELNGPNINISCPGTFTVQGAAHEFKGPASDVASLDDSATQSLNVSPGNIGARSGPEEPGQGVAARQQASAADTQTEPAFATAEHDREDRQPRSPVVFHIVTQHVLLSELLDELYADQKPGLAGHIRSINPQLKSDMLLPGQLVLLSDPDTLPDPPNALARAQAAAQQAEDARIENGQYASDIAMEHWDLLDDLSRTGSAGVGLFASATGKKLDAVQRVLKEVESLHIQQFARHGNLRHPEFFAARRALFAQLDTALGQLTLRYTGFTDSAKVKAQLGLSSKSIAHAWTEAGTSAGGIPGYAENFTRITRYARYIKTVGHVGIVLEGVTSVSRVREACTAGREAECPEVAFAEGGRLLGSMAGGWFGASGAYLACSVAFSVPSGGASFLGCALLAGGIGGAAGGTLGGNLGYRSGRKLWDISN